MPLGLPPRAKLTARIGRALGVGIPSSDAGRAEASRLLTAGNKEDDRVRKGRSDRAVASTRAGLASDENAGRVRTTAPETGPKPRPAISPPKPRAQTALGSGGTRAGLASDENANRPRPAAAAADAPVSGRRALVTASGRSEGVHPETFVRPFGMKKGKGLMGRIGDALASNSGRQQRMARERSMAEGRKD